MVRVHFGPPLHLIRLNESPETTDDSLSRIRLWSNSKTKSKAQRKRVLIWRGDSNRSWGKAACWFSANERVANRRHVPWKLNIVKYDAIYEKATVRKFFSRFWFKNLQRVKIQFLLNKKLLLLSLHNSTIITRTKQLDLSIDSWLKSLENAEPIQKGRECSEAIHYKFKAQRSGFEFERRSRLAVKYLTFS